MRTLIYIFMSAITFTACCDRCDCEESHTSYFNRSGSFTIEKIDFFSINHGEPTLCGRRHFEAMLYPMQFGISEAAIGDSIYKEKGSFTYILVKKDSSYAFLLDCDTVVPASARANASPHANWGREQSVLIKSWKNGDSVKLKEIIR